MYNNSTNKYHNRKVSVDGHTFDSKLEAERYMYLKDCQNRGEIFNLQLQVQFQLIPTQYITVERIGKKGQPLTPHEKCIERGVTYIADFTYYSPGGTLCIEDTKGIMTQEYIIKRKLMRYQGNPITQVKSPCQPLFGL